MKDTLTISGFLLMCVGVLVALLGEMPLIQQAANRQPVYWAWCISLWASGALITSLGNLLVARNSDSADTPGEKLLSVYRQQHPFRQLAAAERLWIPVAAGAGLMAVGALTAFVGIAAGGGRATNTAAVMAAILVNSGIACVVESLAGPRAERVRIPTYHWILAAPAVLSGGEFETFDTRDVEELRRNLIQWWGIHNAEDFWPIYDHLLAGRHEQQFREYLRLVDSESQQSATVRHRNRQYEYVRQFGERLRHHGIIGWDLGRAIALPKWCAEAGYLRPKEAWKLMFDAAQRLQQRFDTWDEYAESFLSGMAFWNQDRMPEYAEWISWLRASPESPWNCLPWQTPLDADLPPPTMPGRQSDSNPAI